MDTQESGRTFAELLDGLVTVAQRNDIPHHVARQAHSATARAIGLRPSAPVTRAVCRRAEAYFGACVRKMTVRGAAGPRAAARLVAAAIVADLLDAGRDSLSVWRELERGWGERLPLDVLEEYRVRLCG